MKKLKADDIIINIISYGGITIFALICIFPFLYVLLYSITPYSEYLANPLQLIPSRIDLTAYKQILRFPLIYSGYKVTLFVTVIGTVMNLLLLVVSAYPLTKKNLKGRNLILAFITFTMFFNGGMIPNYLLIKELGLYNKIWALIVPGAISAFNLILMKNFITATIPETLEEAAIIDGANEFIVLVKIIIPLSKPAIATFAIFCAVGHWNSYFSAIIYIVSRQLWPLTVVLRELIIESNTGLIDQAVELVNSSERSNPFTLKMAVIIVATLPIITIYPFFQRYFIKGMMIGSVKG
jgi:putative aldouronate transport system permease protein